MTRSVTAAIIAATACVWLTWEAVVVGGERGDTFSEVIRDWSRQWPVLGYALGALLGHWLFPWKHGRVGAAYWLPLAALAAVGGALQWLSVPPGLAAVVGAVLGVGLWPLSPGGRRG